MKAASTIAAVGTLLLGLALLTSQSSGQDAASKPAATKPAATATAASTPASKPVAAKATTPKQAAVNFCIAVDTNDRELFLASIHANKSDKDFVDIIADSMLAVVDLQKSVEKAYGKEETCKVFGGSNGPGGVPLPAEMESKAVAKEEGDTAAITLPDTPAPLQLVRVDGVWKIKFDDAVPPAGQQATALKTLKSMIQASAVAKAAIGKPDMTPEKIQKAFQSEMLRLLMDGK